MEKTHPDELCKRCTRCKLCLDLPDPSHSVLFPSYNPFLVDSTGFFDTLFQGKTEKSRSQVHRVHAKYRTFTGRQRVWTNWPDKVTKLLNFRSFFCWGFFLRFVLFFFAIWSFLAWRLGRIWARWVSCCPRVFPMVHLMDPKSLPWCHWYPWCHPNLQCSCPKDMSAAMAVYLGKTRPTSKVIIQSQGFLVAL